MNKKLLLIGAIALTTVFDAMPAARGGKIAQFQNAKGRLYEGLFKGDKNILQGALKNEMVKKNLNSITLGRTAIVGGTILEDVPPLYTASLIGFVDGIELLLKAGAKWGVKGANSYSQFSPIHYLARSRWMGERSPEQIQTEKEKLKKLISSTDANLADNIGWTPLMYACMDGNEISAKLFLAAGADVTLRNKVGNTALYLAAQGNAEHNGPLSAACIDLLLKAGADVNSVNSHGVSPLVVAIQLDHVDCVKRLLQEEAVDVNIAENILKATPLHIAIGHGHPVCVKLLAHDMRTNLRLEDSEGRTPMQMAVASDNDEIIAIMTEAVRQRAAAISPISSTKSELYSSLPSSSSLGSYSESRSDDEVSEYDEAEVDEELPVLISLEDTGLADRALCKDRNPAMQPNKIIDKVTGWTPLFYAIQAGDVEAVEFLLFDAEVDPQMADVAGNSPLKMVENMEPTPEINQIKRLLNERIKFLTLQKNVLQQ